MELQENQKIIEQIIQAPVSSEKDERKDFDLFRDNLDLILESADLIINTPELYYASFNAANINLAYLGGHQAPIGVLLQLWKDGILMGKCPKCYGKVYIFCAGGSPLSGSHSCLGICRDCRKISKIQLSSVGPIIEALKHLKANINKRKILRTKGQYFSWGDGLMGEPVPDEIIEEGIQPQTIKGLVTMLKQYNNEIRNGVE